jgi:hypothetical protein
LPICFLLFGGHYPGGVNIQEADVHRDVQPARIDAQGFFQNFQIQVRQSVFHPGDGFFR